MAKKKSKASAENGGSRSQQRVVSRTDTDLLNALQELPCALDIIYRRGQPKSDSVPTLREQINRFLDAEASAANDKLTA